MDRGKTGFGSALRRWALLRMLGFARAALARDPTPAAIRTRVARTARLVARRERYRSSPPVAIADCDARWIEPEGIDPVAVILYMHGGAFIVEAPDLYDPMLAAICRASGARGLMVRYRLAPEHPFPAALDDCYEAYGWLLAAGIDPGRIVIAGDSAGGNLAVVTAIRARDAILPQPAGLVLLSPVLDATFSGESFVRNDGVDAMFRAQTLRSLEPYYAAGVDRRHPWLSPLWSDLEGLPPALLLAGSTELLLDDSVRYANLAAGATLQVWHGMPHVFPLFRGLAEGDAAIEGIGRYIRKCTAPATGVGG